MLFMVLMTGCGSQQFTAQKSDSTERVPDQIEPSERESSAITSDRSRPLRLGYHHTSARKAPESTSGENRALESRSHRPTALTQAPLAPPRAPQPIDGICGLNHDHASAPFVKPPQPTALLWGGVKNKISRLFQPHGPAQHRPLEQNLTDKQFIAAIISVLLPPLGVALYQGGLTTQFWINLLLWLLAVVLFSSLASPLGTLGYVAAVVHALYVIFEL